jgi:hypothetical protein
MSMSVGAMVIQRHSPFDVSMSFCGISGSDSSRGAALEVALSAFSSSAGATEAGCVASGSEVATLAPRFMTQGSFVLGFLKGRPCVQDNFNSYEHRSGCLLHLPQLGLPSSHFTRFRLHSEQPVRDFDPPAPVALGSDMLIANPSVWSLIGIEKAG